MSGWLNMISARSLKPELEIPDEVWKLLLERDFVNFAVPLLNPPAEKNGVLTWSGRELMTVSPSLAAFYADEEAELFMPYGEMFKVLANESKTVFAQIYAVFFEKLDGEWRMIYRMMNCSRAVGSRTRDDLKSDSDILSSNWMLSLSGTENWLTLDAYLDFYCKFESYDKHLVAANIYGQLDYMEGPKARLDETRIMPMPGGTVVLVSSLRKGWALVVDVVKNSRTARFVM
ncbi:MAG: hypothetical protein LBQ19_05785, partial [Synergistaceae bacterium]|nr:hypothetical protein [Synergistaceae bacterium]